jgi:hypothetical protein
MFDCLHRPYIGMPGILIHPFCFGRERTVGG